MTVWSKLRVVQPRVWHLIILTAFALAFLVVLVQAQRGDHQLHEDMFTTIQHLEHLNDVVKEEVLRIRVGDVQNYDRLSAALHEFGIALSFIEARVGPDSHHGEALKTPAERYRKLHEQRAVLVEDFKSKFAILRNSLSALPLSLPALVAEFRLILKRPDLADHLRDLASDVMLYSVTSDELVRNVAVARIHRLAPEADGLHEPIRSRLQMLLGHARLILDNSKAVQELLEEILAQPVAEMNAGLLDAYATIHDPVEDQARFYRTLMVLLGGLFAAYILFLVIRVQRARNDLRAANARLSEAQRQAEEAQAQLLEAVEAMDEGFVLFDAEDRLILCNSAYRRLHPHLQEVIQPGQRFEEIVRTHVLSGLVPDAVGHEEEWVSRRMQQWREARAEGSILQQAGRWIMHRDRRTPSGRRVGIRTDVTSLKDREAELAVAKEKAVLADRAKSEFLANMSHEIRTPMNGIMGMAQLLARSDLAPKQKMYADVIVKSGDALVTIINDILDFSKIDAGRLELDPQPFALAEAIEDVAALFSTRAEEKGLELALRIEPGLPEVVIGDVGRLRQIVTNLVGNALKFTESGQVLIDVSGEPQEAHLALQVRVADTGIGIPADRVESVFEQFSQVDGSSTRRHEGTGLGLTISKRLVEKMGGEIGVESEMGKGSVFWFKVALPVHGEAARRHSCPSGVAGAEILVVDDNETNRAILLEQLASWQFGVVAVASGEEGLAALRRAASRGRPFDLVVLDHNMPGMNGADVARAVRSDRSIAATPIIMLTSVTQLGDGNHYRDIGVQAHLVKPARFGAMLETLISVLHEARLGAASAGGATSEPAGTVMRRAAGAA